MQLPFCGKPPKPHQTLNRSPTEVAPLSPRGWGSKMYLTYFKQLMLEVAPTNDGNTIPPLDGRSCGIHLRTECAEGPLSQSSCWPQRTSSSSPCSSPCVCAHQRPSLPPSSLLFVESSGAAWPASGCEWDSQACLLAGDFREGIRSYEPESTCRGLSYASALPFPPTRLHRGLPLKLLML